MLKILIVEDELIVARDIRKTLERNGYDITGVCRTVEEAILLAKEQRPALVLIDIFLKGNLTGIDLAVKLNEEGIPFIYVSANSNQPVLEAAKSTNPYGFIVKPFREKDLLVTIDIAFYRYENIRKMQVAAASFTEVLKQENNSTNKPVTNQQKKVTQNSGNLIGRSAGMLQVFNLIYQVAPFDTSVLLLGESGTGKEGVANYIFQQSKRNDKPFIKINCAAIPSSLIEAEFFGYEKGAFTGAYDRKAGKFELAVGGTILLDEIGEIPLDMQAKLLRVLQEKEIQRIGSNTIIKTDVRIIAATSKNLEKEVAEGRFRLDLYYRLNVFPISLPPLRQRREDIPLLVDHFIRYYSKKSGKNVTAVAENVMNSLIIYDWPGNVRELQHLIERNVLLASDDIIREDVLQNNNLAADTKSNSLTKTVEEIEKTYILSVLEKCNYRIAGKDGAAEILNIPSTTLHSKMKKFGIKKSHQ
jgi:DNA-binding NtrC family response regulator